MSLTKKWGTQDIDPHTSRGDFVPVCQKLTIFKYNHVTPHFKENFILNRNQVVVKNRKNHYFDCFQFLAKSRNKNEGFLLQFYYFEPVTNFLPALIEKDEKYAVCNLKLLKLQYNDVIWVKQVFLTVNVHTTYS